MNEWRMRRRPWESAKLIGGGSRRWFRTWHGREQYHEPMNHDTVTVQCDRIGICIRCLGS